MVYAQAMAVPAAKMQYVTGLYGKAPVTPVVSRFSSTEAILRNLSVSTLLFKLVATCILRYG